MMREKGRLRETEGELEDRKKGRVRENGKNRE